MSTLRRIFTLALSCALALGVMTGTALAAGKPAPAAKVNINSASAVQLGELPGIGPKLAARIVEYRQKAGPFKSPQELLNVKGIGEKNLEKLTPHVSVGEAQRASK